jgi:hypothetical protein
MWKESIENPDKFWGAVADELFWFKKWDKVNEEDFAKLLDEYALLLEFLVNLFAWFNRVEEHEICL